MTALSHPLTRPSYPSAVSSERSACLSARQCSDTGSNEDDAKKLDEATKAWMKLPNELKEAIKKLPQNEENDPTLDLLKLSATDIWKVEAPRTRPRADEWELYKLKDFFHVTWADLH